MKREEITFSIDHRGKATPPRMDLIKEVTSKLKVNENVVIIDKIFSAKGKSTSSMCVLEYKKVEDIPKGKLEKMNARMEKAKKKAAEKKPEEKPAEAKAAGGEGAKEGEAKPEEKKEETTGEKADEKPTEVKETKEKSADGEEEKK